MSLLSLHVGAAGVTALAYDGGVDGGVTARRHEPVTSGSADELWRAVQAAARPLIDEVAAIGVSAAPDRVLLWDRETLGSPRPVLTGPLPVSLARLAEEEPHTWALVESGRYAVGTAESYLVARMTRGTWHLTDVSHAWATGLLDPTDATWSAARCDDAGVPPDALPELVSTWGAPVTTDARSFLGLAVPVAAVVAPDQAATVGQACLEPGDARCDVEALVVTVRSEDGVPAWRSPDGTLARCTTTGPDDLPPDVGVLRVDGPGAADDRACQALADRAGVPVQRPEELDATGVGAAHLAGVGCGLLVDVRRTWRPAATFTPR